MNATFEVIRTVVRHAWGHVDCAPGGEGAELTLSAERPGRVRGSVRQPEAHPHVLRFDGAELVGPVDLDQSRATRARHALDQLLLRVGGKPHVTPDADGRWDASVLVRLRVAGAPAVPSSLDAGGPFTPREMFVEVSTNGAGVVLLFGREPVEVCSAHYTFAVGPGGLVAFDRLDPAEQVPTWAQGRAVEAASAAFEARTAADGLLVDESTGALP